MEKKGGQALEYMVNENMFCNADEQVSRKDYRICSVVPQIDK